MKTIVIGIDDKPFLSCNQSWDNEHWASRDMPRMTPYSTTLHGNVYYILPSDAMFEGL